jgi:hypothetical protein
MTASAWTLYDAVSERIGDGTLDMDTNEFDMILCLSTSNCETASLLLYSEITNEVTTNYGYTQGGAACTGVTISKANQWLRSGSSTKFDVDDVTWTASGGSIVASYAVIKERSTGYLICWSKLETTPVTASTGNTFTVYIHSSGVFTLAPA